MNLSLQNHMKSGPAAAGRLVAELLSDLAPKVLFFFSAFGLLFLLFKLFVAQYSIEYSAFAKAAIAALILGKVVPLLDWAQSGYKFETHRRIVVIASKTVIYAMVVIVLRIGERMLETYREEGSLDKALDFMIARSDGHRFLGLVLLISVVVGAYLTLQEIDRAMGEGALVRLFFEPPLNSSTPQSPPERRHEFDRH